LLVDFPRTNLKLILKLSRAYKRKGERVKETGIEEVRGGVSVKIAAKVKI